MSTEMKLNLKAIGFACMFYVGFELILNLV
jgi:hypothetical protein